ncbi:hypothetical protein BDC45DRAFT_554647 [Circinella umbellata]|nr:hypothetical protein BDC45DRAFT_554647 [Circinella umbellata]
MFSQAWNSFKSSVLSPSSSFTSIFTNDDTQLEQKDKEAVEAEHSLVPSMRLVNDDNESSLSVVTNGSYCDNCYEHLNPSNTKLQRREQKEEAFVRRIDDMLPTVNTHSENPNFVSKRISSDMMVSSAHIPLKRQYSSSNVDNSNVAYQDQESLKRCRIDKDQASFKQGDLFANQLDKDEVHNNECTSFEEPYKQEHQSEHTDSIITHNNNFDDNSDIDTKLKDKGSSNIVDPDSVTHDSSIRASPEKIKRPIRKCQQKPDSKRINSDGSLCTSTAQSDKLSLKKEKKKRTVLKNKQISNNQYFYCPYKGCHTRKNNMPSNLYIHIRKKHYSQFPSLTRGARHIFKTPTDQVIDFKDERVRNLLDPGDPINIFFRRNEEKYRKTCFFCPYMECIAKFQIQLKLFEHIQKLHDPEFDIPPFDSNEEYVFTHPQSGRILLFDEASRKTVSEGQSIMLAIEEKEQNIATVSSSDSCSSSSSSSSSSSDEQTDKKVVWVID